MDRWTQRPTLGQGSLMGLAVPVGEPQMLRGLEEGNMAETVSDHTRREVRPSLAVEGTAATKGLEPAACLRAALVRRTRAASELRCWRRLVASRQLLLIVDAMTGFDALPSEMTGNDRAVVYSKLRVAHHFGDHTIGRCFSADRFTELNVDL